MAQHQYKIGDKFRLKDETRWGGQFAGVMTATSVDTNGVYVDGHPMGRSLFMPGDIELVVPEFKVGDRVEFTSCKLGLMSLVGKQGVVTSSGYGKLMVKVDADTWPHDRVAYPEELTLLPAVVAPVITPLIGARLYPSAKIILKHLKARKTISPMEALASYGCMRLAARIHDLRQAGLKISTELHKDHAGHPYARYTLHAA